MNILEARRRTLGGHILKKTAQGNPAIATGSLARRYPGITMQGWTEQDGTPTPETPVPIVSAGTWDETAQKWEYEIEISNAEQNPTEIQTVTLTSDRPLTKWDRLEKRNGQWGWVYKSNTVVFDGSEDESFNKNNIGNPDDYLYYINVTDKKASPVLCNKLINKSSVPSGTNPGINGSYKNVNLFVNLGTAIGDNNVTSFKAYLQANPITVLYQLAEPVFVPLSASEQEQMDALHTNRPTTVLSNDSDCEMTLTYKTKKSLEVTA